MADTKPAQIGPGATGVTDTLNAPVIYFDLTPNFGLRNGVVTLTLAMARALINPAAGSDVDLVATAFLRCSIPAAEDLRDVLNKALLLAAPAAGGGQRN
jgi:hypothetical protein